MKGGWCSACMVRDARKSGLLTMRVFLKALRSKCGVEVTLSEASANWQSMDADAADDRRPQNSGELEMISASSMSDIPYKSLIASYGSPASPSAVAKAGSVFMPCSRNAMI
jgi:hypothetical protein